MDEGKVASDTELIERCLRKENSAWELVVARFRRKVFHISYKFTGKHDEAEDLTQEIFLKVFKSLDKFNRDADFSTWLSSVARNYCIDRYRAGKREREVLVEDLVAFDLAPASSGNPHRALEDQDRRTFLRKGLDLLPGKLREAVVLRDLQGLSYQEMAERLALPEGTVKSRINRGREELARLLLRAQQPPRRGKGSRARAPRAGGEVMQLVVEERGDVKIVRVQEAKLTYPVLSSFFSEVRQQVEAGARKVVIDLKAVSYIDSASIGCLMDIHRLLQEKSGTVKLSGLQPRVETMISMTGVHKIIDLFREEDDALSAFAARKGDGPMNHVRFTTGFELPLDGDLLGILEALYKEVTLRRELRGSFEDMMREIESLVGQMSEEERKRYLVESLFLNTVTYENEMLDAYVRKLIAAPKRKGGRGRSAGRSL